MGPGCLSLFQDRGYGINQVNGNVKTVVDGREMEIDLMLVNTTELVLVEIKTTARTAHIKKLLADLNEFKNFFPRYSDCNVYGAIAALRFEESCDQLAKKQGLFVLKLMGEGLVHIDNPIEFQPKIF